LLQKKNIPALKESGLASTGKPSAAERMQQGIPSTSINLSDNRKIVNYFIISPLQIEVSRFSWLFFIMKQIMEDF